MRLARRPKRAMPETIIALIDVVFFLLVFFMLIGRLDATAPFEVSPAFSITGSDLPAGGSTISVGTDGSIALDGDVIGEPKLIERIANILSEDPNHKVRVNAHKDAPLQHLLPLLGQIEAIGARDIVLIVTPEAL